jgi:hypothetical protein
MIPGCLLYQFPNLLDHLLLLHVLDS